MVDLIQLQSLFIKKKENGEECNQNFFDSKRIFFFRSLVGFSFRFFRSIFRKDLRNHSNNDWLKGDLHLFLKRAKMLSIS